MDATSVFVFGVSASLLICSSVDVNFAFPPGDVAEGGAGVGDGSLVSCTFASASTLNDTFVICAVISSVVLSFFAGHVDGADNEDDNAGDAGDADEADDADSGGVGEAGAISVCMRMHCLYIFELRSRYFLAFLFLLLFDHTIPS